MSAQHPFAPGAIEHHHPRRIKAHQRRALLRWLVRAGLFTTLVAGVPFVAGLITGALQP